MMEGLTYEVLLQGGSFVLVAFVLWTFLTKFDKALGDQKEILAQIQQSIENQNKVQELLIRLIEKK